MKRATGDLNNLDYYFDISIHALVKRATYLKSRRHKLQQISIHALVKRATFFNDMINQAFDISIHALVKRATLPGT